MNTLTRSICLKLKVPAILIALALATILAGCGGGGGDHHSGSGLSDFERGYRSGFAQDSEYFFGYDDSWFTVGFAPIFYSGGDIPFIDDFSFDAGYYDGVFDAYNDGYFVSYRHAFLIGFSEGYDNAFWPDYLDFLDNDIHIEYLNGGFSDAYNDGFSEGRVFGAFDYEVFLPFDWLDAFLDWESGTDLYFEEVDVGTGLFGPVIYYEWGLDPNLLRSAAETRTSIMRDGPIALRGTADRPVTERDLSQDQIDELSVTPTTTSRTTRDLTLSESWLDRIDAYNQIGRSSATRSSSPRASSSRAR